MATKYKENQECVVEWKLKIELQSEEGDSTVKMKLSQ